jgi:alkanesulfonate monooxygenase SsuD/methylene tetrahydromethanopterin reductase-like flavin-dependent oxidoreductase (luciferase family)
LQQLLIFFRKYFNVAGPHSVEPSPQRTPFIFQAGTSPAGKIFATKHAEAMFIPGMEAHTIRKVADEIRAEIAKNGRDPRSVKLIAGMQVIVDETDELAQAKYEEYLSYADLEGSLALFGGWYGIDLDKYGDYEDFRFAAKREGPIKGIQGMIDAWSATIPGTENVE